MSTKKQLLAEASSLEKSAKENLETWIVLGKTNSYADYMALARYLRLACLRKGKERAEFLEYAPVIKLK